MTKKESIQAMLDGYKVRGESWRAKEAYSFFDGEKFLYGDGDLFDINNTRTNLVWELYQEPPKEKEKLWYWEYFNGIDKWLMCSERFNKNQADKHFTYEHRKLEALGFIVEE